MKKRSVLGTLVALLAGTALVFVACSKDNNGPGSPDPVTYEPSTPTSGNAPAPAPPPTTGQGSGVNCAGKSVLKSADGTLQICVLESTLQLADNRCQTVPESGGTWTYKIGIISTGAGYIIDDIFPAPENSCGAAGGNGFKGPYHNKRFPAGESTMTLTLTRNGDTCGRDQEDFDAVNEANGARVNFRGIVFNYAHPCRSCDNANLQATKTEDVGTNSVKVTINASWNKIAGDKVSLYEGATLLQTITASGAFNQLTLPRDGATHTYNVVLVNGNLKCEKPLTVVVPPKVVPCEGIGTPAFNFTNDNTKVTSKLTYNAGFAGSCSLTPTPASGFMGGAVNSGQAYDSTYNPPASDLTVTGAWQVKKGEEVCASGSKQVTIRHQRTCEDLHIELNATKTGETDTTITYLVTSNVPGVFNPTQPWTYTKGTSPRTENVNFTSTELGCTKSIAVPVPAQQDACEGVGTPAFEFTNVGIAVTSKLTYNGGFAGSETLSPAPASGFMGGAVNSGQAYSSIYNPPASDLTVTGSWQVKKGAKVCASGSKDIVIKHQRTCADVNPIVSVDDITFTSATCTGSWTNPGTGTMQMDSGSTSPIANGGSKTYTGLSAGQHSCNLNVVDGERSCPKSKTFTIEAGQCNLTLDKDVDKTSAVPGDTLTYTLTVANTGTLDCTGGGVKVDDDTPANVQYTTSSGTVGQCTWNGYSGNAVHWNCGTVHPGASITLWWKGKVTNPASNCNDFSITNKASAWSLQRGTIYSPTVTTTVDVTCAPTCEEQNPPEGHITQADGDGQNFHGQASVNNEGNWEVQIRAASSESECNANDPDYIKDTDSRNLACGHQATLNTVYQWKNHPSEWWWVVLYRNGTLDERSSCVRNTNN